MQTYAYVARETKTARQVEGDIQADSEQTAAKLLTDRGLAPLELNLKKEKTSFGAFGSRISTKEKVIFSRQLSTLINAGLPLMQSLRNVKNQTKEKRLNEIIDKIIIDVEAGSSFADSLAKYPRVFSEVYVSLVAAGEASGTLDTSLERLANQQEKEAEIVSKIRGAMLYPLIVLVVLFAVVGFMLTTIVPQVESFYKSIPGAKLPLITELLLKVSHFIISFWWLCFILLGVAAFFSIRWGRTTAGRAALDRVKLHGWLIGPLFEKVYMARFAQTSSTLVASGVPMIKMLETTANAVGNVHVANSVHKATEGVKGGKALSESLRNEPYFLDLVPDMIQIGEQSGSLESMLAKLADYYEKEVDNQIRTISTVIEPVLMVVVGVMALLIVAAVLLPIYGLAGKNILSPSAPTSVK